MSLIFESLLPIFIITILGSVIKRNILKAEEFWRGIEKLSYFILFPSMLFSNIYSSDIQIVALAKLLASITISTLIVCSILVHYGSSKEIEGRKFTSLLLGGVRYNSYIFLGIGSAMFDRSGLSIVATVSAYMIIVINIISISAFYYYVPKNLSSNKNQEQENLFFGMLRKLISNPLIISSVAGLVFNAYEIKIASGILKTLTSLSGSAFAIGCMIIGSNLKFDFKDYSKNEAKDIGVVIMLKLIILPIITAILMKMFSVDGQIKTIGIMFSGLPAATNSYILSRQLGGDYVLMSNIITVTTILSLFSLSLILYIFS